METTAVNIACIYTAPRYENTYCRNVIEVATRKAGLQLSVSQGVYYGQCMQEMMKDVVNNGCQLILTVDGDSIFTSDHIHRLIELCWNSSEYDALAAIQPRRGMHFPLFTMGQEDEVTIRIDPNKPFEVVTAHFGLTAIKVEKLLKCPKPWFHSIPGRDGSWDKRGGKVDDDIYFWKTWNESGNKVFIDPGCRIGHMEEMITFYDPELKIKNCYPNDFEFGSNNKEVSATEALAELASMSEESDPTKLCTSNS